MKAAPVEKDPVCGMTVDPSRAKATHEHAGKTYYFCCRSCQVKFSSDPEKYLHPKTLIGIAPESPKPMQIAPARVRFPPLHVAPNAAVPVAAATTKSANQYTCPMDPEIRQEGPGDCPKCGMALEPVVTAP